MKNNERNVATLPKFRPTYYANPQHLTVMDEQQLIGCLTDIPAHIVDAKHVRSIIGFRYQTSGTDVGLTVNILIRTSSGHQGKITSWDHNQGELSLLVDGSLHPNFVFFLYDHLLEKFSPYILLSIIRDVVTAMTIYSVKNVPSICGGTYES